METWPNEIGATQQERNFLFDTHVVLGVLCEATLIKLITYFSIFRHRFSPRVGIVEYEISKPKI